MDKPLSPSAPPFHFLERVVGNQATVSSHLAAESSWLTCVVALQRALDQASTRPDRHSLMAQA